MTNTFHQDLKNKIDLLVHGIYALTNKFPREELFGITSQLRRAALSVALNYVEGYARMRKAVIINFLEIAYGSLQESKYLLKFAYDEQFMIHEDYKNVADLSEEVGAMLWKTIEHLRRDSWCMMRDL